MEEKILKVENDNIKLTAKINALDSQNKSLATFILAIQKQVIKDVVLYTNSKLSVAK